MEKLRFPYPIKEVRGETDVMVLPADLAQWIKLMLILITIAFLLIILTLGMLIARRKREHSTLWFPEGFFLKKEPSSNKNRREPVGQDALGMK